MEQAFYSISRAVRNIILWVIINFGIVIPRRHGDYWAVYVCIIAMIILFSVLMIDNYCIEFKTDKLILKRLFRKNIEILYDDIDKITFENITWLWAKMYIYIESDIIAYSITNFNKKLLLEHITKICSSNNISIDSKWLDTGF